MPQAPTKKPAPAPAIDYTFDKTNAAAVAWARTHAGALVSNVTTTTRKAIRDTIGDLMDGSTTWDEAHDDLQDIFDDPDRVQTIAHTEAMTAANEGQRQLWNQALDDGLLDGDEQQVWIVTPDDKLCDDCEEMEDETAPLGEDFGPDGDYPPMHPNCRCTVGLEAPDIPDDMRDAVARILGDLTSKDLR